MFTIIPKVELMKGQYQTFKSHIERIESSGITSYIKLKFKNYITRKAEVQRLYHYPICLNELRPRVTRPV